MLRKVLAPLALLWAMSWAAHANEPPKFKDYLAPSLFSGPAATVQIETEAEKTYRTRLRAAGQVPANFAGDQVLTTWGCGMGCTFGAAVSLRTGKVSFLPGTVCCWKGDGARLEFRANSRLLVMAGLINEEGTYGAHFYEFTGQGFRRVKTIAVSEDAEPAPAPAARTRKPDDDAWMKVAETDDTEWRFQPGSLEFTKNKLGTPIAAVSGKSVDKRTRKVEIFRKYVSATDCKRGRGKIVSLDVDNDFQYENEFMAGSGTVASAMAELICSAALKTSREKDGKGI